MKTKLKLVAIISWILGSIPQLYAQGYIVPNGVYMGSVLTNEIDVLQSPTIGDYTGFFLIPQDPNTFLFATYLDEGVRVFLVSPNDPISLQAILANSYSELTYPNNYVFANGSPFYLGLYTGHGGFDPDGNYTGIYTDPLFGWARLMNNNGAIQLLDSALENGGGGIYVGTQNIIPVPEPSTFGLFGLGALLLGWRLRDRQRSTERQPMA